VVLGGRAADELDTSAVVVEATSVGVREGTGAELEVEVWRSILEVDESDPSSNVVDATNVGSCTVCDVLYAAVDPGCARRFAP
jgi:hypothetical protein